MKKWCLLAALVAFPACEKKPAPEQEQKPLVVLREVAPSPERTDAGKPPVSEPAPLWMSVHECDGTIDHLARGQGLVASGELAIGVEELRKALFHAPHDARAFEALGDAARRMKGGSQLAKAAWSELPKLRPDDTEALLKLARLAIAQRDHQGALEATTAAIVRDPTLAEAYHLRGRVSLKLSRLTAATRDFRKATRLDPKHGYAFNNLGYVLLLANRPEEAIAPLEKAAELLPAVPYVHNSLGIAYEKVGWRSSAEDSYERALEIDPGYVKAAVNKARLSQLAAAESEDTLRPLFAPAKDLIPASGEGEEAAPEETPAAPSESEAPATPDTNAVPMPADEGDEDAEMGPMGLDV